ncbi:MAG TPA: glycoside hydrolase family 3 C-terminal domain-containing protein [Verrucomicrobiae bacterium]|jgi:beta-glucosidase|nr:glycoside hydrolase family 3 C-terminal domain-containing protein [Verrucomicrobiae bacterium]
MLLFPSHAMRTIRLFILISFALFINNAVFGADAPLYKDAQAPLEQRVNDLFGRLTQDEKLSLLGGTGFATQPIPRLGVPEMVMADAGQGVRGGPEGTLGPATAFPAGVLMAATWDTNLLWQIGQAIGEEARNKGQGIQILLGPAVNIHRTPLGGRNGEYFTEDPYLAARLAVAYIQGMQSNGISACIKHFACNNQESDRMEVNANVSERALREIYLPAFEAGVKEGNVHSVMSSYNQVNGHHSSANPYLLKEILKKEWGFDGLVMSDWGGVHEADVVQDGNDLEMPTGANMTVPKLKAALADGSVTQAAVDDSVHRILRTIIRVGLLDGPMHPDARKVNSPAHSALALEAAEKGIVLLKNQKNILPLDSAKIKSIAVIGEPADKLQIDALGSPEVHPLHTVELLDAIKARAGKAVIRYVAAGSEGEPLPASVLMSPDGTAHGFEAEYFTNRDLEGVPALTRAENKINLQGPRRPAHGFPGTDFSVRWTAKLTVPESGNYAFTFTGDDGFRIFLDGKPLIDHWVETAAMPITAETQLTAGKTYDLRVEYFQAAGDFTAQLNWQPPGKSLFDKALDAAKNSDVAIVCVSTHRTEGEGGDRPSMDLPAHQADLIRAIAAVNKKTIVVLNNGTPVMMKDWLNKVPAIVEGWFPGQEGGTALAAILFGDINPSGKLPDTLAADRTDYPDANNFPGANHQVNYAEGIYIGYRHFDKNNIQPLFPFGYGLSYTTFGYKNLRLSQAQLAPDGSVTASVDITNIGKRAGEEVAELYIHDLHPQIDKPVRELKGFSKISLQPGETKTVQFTIHPRDLAYFDVPGKQWKADVGEYEIGIGASSRDIRQKATLQLDGIFKDKVSSSN